MSNLHRLRLTDRIFFVGVNLEEEFNRRLGYMHLNPVRKRRVKRPEDWRWSSYHQFTVDKATVAACPIPIDYVRLPLGYRA